MVQVDEVYLNFKQNFPRDKLCTKILCKGFRVKARFSLLRIFPKKSSFYINNIKMMIFYKKYASKMTQCGAFK